MARSVEDQLPGGGLWNVRHRGGPAGRAKIANGTYHIASGSIAAVLGSSLVGIDMRDYKGRNWVRLCRVYFNNANGRNVFMEHVREFEAAKVGGCYAFDFWGDVLPSLLAMELASCYPQETIPGRAAADHGGPICRGDQDPVGNSGEIRLEHV